MADTARHDDLPTRGRLLRALRHAPATVAELAVSVGVTPNGVRAGLATLERDGLIRRAGVRRLSGVGKPPQLYTATARAHEHFSVAYIPALATFTAAVAERTDLDELTSIFGAAGERLAPLVAGPRTSDPVTAATIILESLGAAVTTAQEGAVTIVAGAACPLSAVVRDCPAACEMVRAMLATATGAVVTTVCEHGSAPRCRFAIG